MVKNNKTNRKTGGRGAFAVEFQQRRLPDFSLSNSSRKVKKQ
jgi:hypothetical protein